MSSLKSPPPVEVHQSALIREFQDAAMSNDISEPTAWSRALLQDAHRERATDIHIDPHRNGSRIRLRIDGVLQDAAHVPHEVAQQLVNQMKVMAQLDPFVAELPMESRWREEIGDQAFDIRLTTMMCQGGEKLHARMLDRNRLELSIESLGLSSGQRESIERWQRERDGILLVTGPTGAGKTTTLYSIIQHFVESQQNVLTIEDPIEYQLDGATQIQVDEDNGLDFAQGIRVMLRLDPDCMLIGELRDDESAITAMKAAASGHTVLSTLHTRDAVGSINVLRQWGVKDGSLATLLSVIVNQRLLGKLCPKCRTTRDLSAVEKEWLESNGFDPETNGWSAHGCGHCSQTGVHGRVGVYEVWKLTDDDRRQVASVADERQLRELLRERSHEFLKQDIHRKFCDGIINLPIAE